MQISVISPHPNPNPCQISHFCEVLVNGFATPHPTPTPSHVR